jgi:hypothetical protein
VRRGVALLDRKQVLIEDELKCAAPADVWWFAHTPAEVILSSDGRIATLSLGGKTLTARLLSPEHATFKVMDAAPLPSSPQPANQNENRGIRKLTIHLANVSNLRLAILLKTEPRDSPPMAPKVVALQDW